MPPRRTPFRGQKGVDSPVALSVVLPCYRAAALARESVRTLVNAFERRLDSYEIIVVDDGAHDCEQALAGISAGSNGRVGVITLAHNRGKGAAVAAGMAKARGAVRVYTDIDVPYGPEPILLIESLIRTREFHVVIGDRTFPQSRYETELPIGRRAASSVFSFITATLVTGGFFDTQCGLKGFRGDIAEVLFGLQRVERFAFDVELLYVALKYGLEIKRIPVVLESNTTSSVRLGRDAVQTFIDVARIKLNQMQGFYRSDVLIDLVARECATFAIEHPPAGRQPLRIHG